jgi:hypothetical protein
MRKIYVAVTAFAGALIAGGILYGQDLSYAPHQGPGEVTAKTLPRDYVKARVALNRNAAKKIGAGSEKFILFGDLHVHTTFSTDAFMLSLPILGGEGSHPPADACDFARFCSAVDFWSINDHAESLTPQRWAETRQSIRACNAVTGSEEPDVVAFLGWEWTQMGMTPDTHYGHKNIILRDIEDAKVPARPIAATGESSSSLARQSTNNREIAARLEKLDPAGPSSLYAMYGRFMDELAMVPDCPQGQAETALPASCYETAPTPKELFAKFDEWRTEAIVIPHGTSWGFYTPAGSSWDKQLTRDYHDPKRQFLIEIFSGHGNSEEYRDFRAVRFDAAGNPLCPEPSPDYLPSCWRAGEIIKGRCQKAGMALAECDKRAADTRALYLRSGMPGWRVVPGTHPDDWLDAGQCKDCFMPAFNLRPMNSAQYIAAVSNFDEGTPSRALFGYVAASDNHQGRPGTGFKEFDRPSNTETANPPTLDVLKAMMRVREGDPAATRPLPLEQQKTFNGFARAELERLMNFSGTGGLTAVHTRTRDRAGIWQALQDKEVYGTSGDRILLWFDLVNGPKGAAPMGAHVTLGADPRFRVRAVGALKQKPGCPAHSLDALGAERIRTLCNSECYHPSDERKLITRIEVIRIRPQMKAGEKIDGLIEDPWKVFTCSSDQNGCAVEFSDEEFSAAGRDAAYYVRAIEEPSDAVNGANLRCSYDAQGNCVKVNSCYLEHMSDKNEDCLAPVEERAWSSPIHVDHKG